MWGIFRQLYDVGILNFQTTHDLLWLYLAYIFPISSIYLPYTLNVPSFFLPSFYLLPTHYFVFTKGIFNVVIVRYGLSMSQELSIFFNSLNCELSSEFFLKSLLFCGWIVLPDCCRPFPRALPSPFLHNILSSRAGLCRWHRGTT